MRAGPFVGDEARDVLIDDAGAGGDRVGGVRCACVSPSPTAAAMPPCAQTLDAPSPSGAAASTVTGSGASFSAVKSPASPAPMMTTSPSAPRRSSRAGRKRVLREASDLRAIDIPRRDCTGRRRIAPPARHQFVRLTMRSTARRAFAATSGSTCTS